MGEVYRRYVRGEVHLPALEWVAVGFSSDVSRTEVKSMQYSILIPW